MAEFAEIFAEAFPNASKLEPENSSWVLVLYPEFGALVSPDAHYGERSISITDQYLSDLWGDLSVGEFANDLRKVARNNQTGNTNSISGSDALAFYWPYCFAGPNRWGIYWNEPAMLRAVAQVALDIYEKAKSASLRTVAYYIRNAVRQHELVHFAIEYTAAHVGLQHKTDFYTNGITNRQRRDSEEMLATAHEIQWLSARRASARTTRKELNAILNSWRTQPLSVPYNQWQKASDNWRNIAETHAKSMGMPEQAGLLYRDMLQLAPETSKLSVIPEFSFGIRRILSGPHANLWLRLCPPPVTKVIKHARKAEHSGSPPGVFIGTKAKHPICISRLGKRRAVPIDPAKWDRVPLHVLQQLAELFDLTQAEYVQQVLGTSP